MTKQDASIHAAILNYCSGDKTIEETLQRIHEQHEVDFAKFLKPWITGYMKNLAAFADTSEDECWQRWLNGMQSGKRGAEKILCFVVSMLLDIDRFEDL